MPININLNSTADIASLKLDQFTAGNNMNPTSGKITIAGTHGSSTYNVSFQNGKVNVSRGFNILNLFTKNYSKDIVNALKSQFGAQCIAKNNAKLLDDSLQSGLLQKNSEVAMYGMSTPRDSAIKEMKNFSDTHGSGLKPVTIDEYNAQVGILWGNLSYDSLDEHLSSIKGDFKTLNENANFVKEQTNSPSYALVKNGIQNERLDAYRTFLKKNVDKLDIFGKFGKMVSADGTQAPKGAKKSGWEHMVRTKGLEKTVTAFIAKNLDKDQREYMQQSPDDLEKVAKLFIELGKLHNSQGKVTRDAVTQLMNKFEKEHPLRNPNTSYHEVMDIVTKTSFFRQTSKLGLQFFKESGTPVIFQFSSHDNQSMLNKTGNKTINDKWWNSNGPVALNKYAPITFSEMRQVQRMQATNPSNPNENFTVLTVGGGNNIS